MTAETSGFDNDNATDEDRATYLQQHNAQISETEGDEQAQVFTLNYSGGSMILDATTKEDALFEACNIV